MLLRCLDGLEWCVLSCTIHRQRFRDDREILVLNDRPLAISRGLKMSMISGNVMQGKAMKLDHHYS